MNTDLLRVINQLLALDDRDDAQKTQLIAHHKDARVRALAGKLTTRDILMLATIAQQVPYPQKALAAAVNTSQPTASRAVTRLHRLGLLTRTRIPTNQKEWQLTLTSLGQILAAAKTAHDQRLAQRAAAITAAYSQSELARFTQLLQALIALQRDA
ncbi:MarR family transcriptional regulator [Lacticaseibacillus daqingensis]|uniref:MarR family transcriptional regulator n=1 Tax=Lacticaseibacillus daqingensis TaxID=2486014 RepID=UPI0013DD8F99|nr:MarR family transcriptional regulator [Lacticaseibacillus daqingensis]